MSRPSVFFAPELFLREVAPAIEFYASAFDAKLLRQWNNDDGSVHVAEMAIDGAVFHLHEQTKRVNELSPDETRATTVVVGLFVDDPHTLMTKALGAGGKEIEPVTDYDYGYRQGKLADPFGHHWLLEKKIGPPSHP